MANYSTLKAAVADVVKTNGTQAITGANLQAVLLSIINSVGGGGYIFAGVATPSTDAGTPDQNVFYIGGAGTYANFGTSITVPVGSVCVFKYNGSWVKEQIAIYDDINAAPFAVGRKIFEKTLVTESTQQRIALDEFEYGKNIAIRIKEATATANIQVDVRYNENQHSYYSLSDEWQIIEKDYDINRLYIYTEGASVAGDVNVEVVWGDLARLYGADIQPVQNSNKLITSGGVYNAVGSKLNRMVQELFLIGLDSSKSYYCAAFYDTSISKAVVRVYEVGGSAICIYQGTTLNGVVLLEGNLYDGAVYGWALIDIRTSDTTLVTNDSIDLEKCSDIHYSPILEEVLGENLWGFGEYSLLRDDGSINPHNAFMVSDYIPVFKKDIKVYHCSGGGTGYCAAAFYTANRTLISVYDFDGSAVINYTISAEDIPANCSYIRFNAYKNAKPFISMTDNEKEIMNAINKSELSFNSLHGAGALSQDSYLLLDKIHISKNIVYTARILGDIQNISIGNGYIVPETAHPNSRGYGAMWVNITPTQVLFYQNFSTTETLAATYDHELTLSNETTVSIISHFTETGLSAKILLSDGKGNLFDHSLPSWGLGRPFAQNLGTSSLNVEMRFMPTDIYCPVWIFGDSYLGYAADNRWLYYAVHNGFSHFLLDARAGENAEEAWYDLNTLLNAGGKPKTLCWCLGMNGSSSEQYVDGQYIINPFQKTYIDKVKALCEGLGIVPVFATIPTVPSLQKTGQCDYVRSLGCRYIDFAEAVGANSSGVWKDGMLSSDEVHPTTLGAEALASRAFLDCPEIAEGMILLT